LAYVFFHGGGWHQFSKDSLTRPFFRHLAAQGHVVMDVAYRLHPEADLIGMVGDAKRAVAWMKANAERYGADPEWIIVAGGSAGGHLALLAAYTPGHPELTPADIRGLDSTVRAVVASYPVVDLRSYLTNNDYRTIDFGLFEVTSPREVVPRLVGGTPAQVPERYDLLTPTNHVSPECPPTLLLQAGHDHVVPIEPVRDLHRKLVAAGVPAIYIEYPATEHVFDFVLPRFSPAARAVWHEIDRFLALVRRT
jgi:acetyl esterase/lipase